MKIRLLKIGSNKAFHVNGPKLSRGPTPSRDNCIMTMDGKIGFITSFEKDKLRMTALNSTDLFSLPCSSSEVGIFKTTSEIGSFVVNKVDIMSKMVMMPQDNFFIAIELLK